MDATSGYPKMTTIHATAAAILHPVLAPPGSVCEVKVQMMINPPSDANKPAVTRRFRRDRRSSTPRVSNVPCSTSAI